MIILVIGKCGQVVLLSIVISVVLASSVIPEVRAYQVLEHTLCKNVKGTEKYETYEVVEATNRFSIFDEKVALFCWVDISDLRASDKFKVITMWYNPGGTVHSRHESDIYGGYRWKMWRSLAISGKGLTKGKWAVEMAFDGGPFKNEVLFKDFFTIGVRTATIQLVGIPESASANILIDGKSSGSILGSEKKSYEFLEELQYRITIDEYVSGAPGVRYHCSAYTWIISSSGPLIESHQFTYDIEYQLTVSSPYGEVRGGGWYGKGTTASFSVSSTAPLEGIFGMLGGKRVFQKWTGDSSSTSSSSTIVMDAPHKVTALWQEDIMMPMIIIVVLAAGVLSVIVVLIVFRRRRGEAVPIAPTAAPTPVVAPSPPIREVVSPTTEAPQVPAKAYCMICGEELSSTTGHCTRCGAKQAI